MSDKERAMRERSPEPSVPEPIFDLAESGHVLATFRPSALLLPSGKTGPLEEMDQVPAAQGAPTSNQPATCKAPRTMRTALPCHSKEFRKYAARILRPKT